MDLLYLLYYGMNIYSSFQRVAQKPRGIGDVMYAQLTRLCFIVFCFSLCIANFAQAQQLIFNVPSPDIMDPGRLLLSAGHYLRPWHTSSGPLELLALQGVYGIGHNMEMGLNAGPFNYRHLGDSAPFMDATLKWRPWQMQFGNNELRRVKLGLIVGDNLGIGINGNVSGHVRNLAYIAPYIDLGMSGTRISAGAYHATHDAFNTPAHVGAQLTLEQSITLIPGLTLAADWYSGNGGFLTPGLLWSKDNFSAGIGYSLSNNDRRNDLIVLGTAFKF